MIYYAFYDSPIGKLLMIGRDSALTGLYLRNLEVGSDWTEWPDRFRPIFSWLDSYFLGKPYDPDFAIHLTGTPFQLQIWEILQSIPFGTTRTYGDIAREMALRTGKQKMSSQAVGQAVGRNPISIIIPCHRVIGAGNVLTGYAGGLDNKRWLLNHEGCLK